MRKARQCAKCPKWGCGWCSILGVRRVGTAPSCAYGRKLMHNAYVAGWIRARRKAMKGAVKK